jgi:molybdenum cofactor cytidylyltransferase
MRFERIPTEQAEHSVLAHSLNVSGRRLAKGRRLERDDLTQLLEAGYPDVMVALLGDNDVDEDSAAGALAERLCGPGVELGRPFTGRCNLYAATDGVFQLDVDAINAVNGVDEAITVATVAPMARVKQGQMLATVKIIPFAVDRGVLDRTLAAVSTTLASVSSFRPRRVGLLLTVLPGAKQKLNDKAEHAVRLRVEGLGSALSTVRSCEHSVDAVSAEMKAMLDGNVDLLLVFAASAITDRRDVIPAALEQVGGVVERCGMPVDPGNLLLLGKHGSVPVVGLPGCARSPKMNGFDWVLERLLADIPVDSTSISRMGVGGLLTEIQERPQPRAAAKPAAPRRPRVAALVLAAGRSSRMGADNKLLSEWRGKALVRHVVEQALRSQADPVYVVTGHQADDVASALSDLPAIVIYNAGYRQGLSTSLNAGLRALPEHVDGVLVCLGDMPQVSAEQLDQLIEAFAPQEGRTICLPTYHGKRGNPVLLGRQLFPDVACLEGDTGARRLVEANQEIVAEVPVDQPGVLIDVDTPQALDSLSG